MSREDFFFLNFGGLLEGLLSCNKEVERDVVSNSFFLPGEKNLVCGVNLIL